MHVQSQKLILDFCRKSVICPFFENVVYEAVTEFMAATKKATRVAQSIGYGGHGGQCPLHNLGGCKSYRGVQGLQEGKKPLLHTLKT